MPGQIILLHGASSAGKSTIARALQKAIDVPFLYLSIDCLRDAGVLPLEEIRGGKFDWSAMREPFFQGFHHSLAAFAGSGNNLIVEHIIESDEWMTTLLRLLTGFDVFFVEVQCPLPELERRELSRGDRPIGDARRDFMTIRLDAEFDLKLSGTEPPDANVQQILGAWRDRVPPSAFERMA